MKTLITTLLTSIFFITSCFATTNPYTFTYCEEASCQTKFKEFKKLANHGSPEAQVTVAGMYYAGYGIKKSSEQSLRWYRKAGRQGVSFARYRSGLLYLYDKDIERNVSKGIDLLTLAAKGDSSDASYRLANLYIQGTLVPEDMVQAEKWLVQASKLNNSNAQYQLGLLYESGVLGTKDIDTALVFYQKAATTHPLAQQRLSILGADSSQQLVAKNNDSIEHITVTAPDLIDVLDLSLNSIKAQNIYTKNQTNTRLRGQRCEKCKVINGKTEIEDFYYYNGVH